MTAAGLSPARNVPGVAATQATSTTASFRIIQPGTPAGFAGRTRQRASSWRPGVACDWQTPHSLSAGAGLGRDVADDEGDTDVQVVAVAPKPDEFPRLPDAMGELKRQKYDWSADVAKLGKSTIPVMLVYGDADVTRPEHEIKFYQLLGGGPHGPLPG